MTRQILLTQGKSALISDEDYERISQHGWWAAKNSGTWYAIRHDRDADGKRLTVIMHRVILGAPDEVEVDHIDGDGLNNVRQNLRLCTTEQNQYNRGPSRTNTSGFKGVCWHKGNKRWMATIRHKGKRIFLGYRLTPEQAARLYDAAARELHGNFARLNFPEGGC